MSTDYSYSPLIFVRRIVSDPLDERRDMLTNHFDSENTSDIFLPVEENDANYVSRQSTILLANILEVKERISQVECIFRRQLYPNFQKNSKCAQKLCAEVRAIAEYEWKERVDDLKKLLNDANVDKEQAVEDFKAVKAEKIKLLERNAELEEILATKTKDFDLKSSVVMSNEKQIKEQEENIMLLNKNLEEKNEEVNEVKKLTQELMMNISSCKLMLSNSEKEKEQLEMQLKNMEASLDDLNNELRRKMVELQEANQLQEHLGEQVDRNKIELTNKDLQISSCEKEKQVLLSKINHLEKKAENVRDNLRNEVTVMPNINSLTNQLKSKKSELPIETQKRRDVVPVSSYKRLLSENSYLRKKLGVSNEESLLRIKAEEASDQLSDENKTSTSSEVKVKEEVDCIEDSDDDISGRLNQMSNRSTSPTPTDRPAQKKPGSSGGIKRPASGWRETRSRQSPGGADPHDDFLDTPYDNIKGNLIINKAADDNSDDETQDMTRTKRSPDKQVQKAPRIGIKDYKFVAPVRKKAERENLNGIECKQCKKFYDAVLGDAEGKDGETSRQNHRCEHHDGVSRHRYRYVPPLTPEGFWNIGFDTEN